MFSSTTPAPAATLRSGRRRPRPTSSEGSVSQPKAKRQRSALTDQTFEPPNKSPEMQEVKLNKVNGSVAKREAPKIVQTPRRDLVVRGKKPNLPERAIKGDGSVILTHSDTYTVSRLPAWPEKFQSDSADRRHGAISSETGYALALTHTNASVWSYTSNTTSPETFTFTLPHPAKDASDPLPLGALVTSSSSSVEPGLVVVMPVSGRITYWESIASATTMDFIQQQRNGVETTLSGLHNGETVVQLVNAESVGFILGLSTGRLVHMCVRDGQGRPDIAVQFLRGGSNTAGSGLFGSLRNVLGSSAGRGELAAAKAGPALKPGERDVVTATSKGRLQVWSLIRGGQNSLRAEHECRETIVSHLKVSHSELKDFLIENFEILDFSFAPRSLIDSRVEAVKNNAETPLLLLTSLSGKGTTNYFMVHVTMNSVSQSSIEIGIIRRIRSYTSPINRYRVSKPKIYLPSPGLVAFIIFDQAVVIASMAGEMDSPDHQLLADSQIPIKNYEDVIDFRTDKGVEINGCGMEEPHPISIDDSKSKRFRAKNPGVILLVRGGGILRIAITKETVELEGPKGPQITAQSKLEQAVFFGTLADNPLRFSGRTELQFDSQEIGEAAIQLSRQILSSTSQYIPALIASIEDNLKRRSAALRALAMHLAEMKVSLDHKTRWQLLWDAEKMAGATAVWEKYDENLRQKAVGNKRSLLNDIVECIHENYKSEPIEEAGELDRVRHWFINDIYRIQVAIPWAFQAVKLRYMDGDLDNNGIVAMVSEADDFVKGCLEAAFEFRTRNLELYGLHEEELENGILKSGYEDLDEFWTSTEFTKENVKKLTEMGQDIVKHCMEAAEDKDMQKPPNPTEISKIRSENVQLVDLCTKCARERYRWLLSRDNRIRKQEGEELMLATKDVEDQQICFLAKAGLPDAALFLAEKNRVYKALASLVVEELEKITMQQSFPLDTDQQNKLTKRSKHLIALLGRYFDLFGNKFAVAFYNYYIERAELFAMLFENERPDYLTTFLRSKPSYAKIAWINEVTQENDLDHAASTLLDLGLRREQDLWSKKIELSIGKLSRVAGMGEHALDLTSDSPSQFELSVVRNQLQLINIQERIMKDIQPHIDDALDQSAELQLALEIFGGGNLTGRPALFALLGEAMETLINHRVLSGLQLVDILTLMNSNHDYQDGSELDGQEFYLALQALKASRLEKSDVDLVEKVIWRRCMIRDNWHGLNNTDLKDDDQVEHQLRSTALYLTLRACVKNRLFEKPSESRLVTPHDAEGAGDDLDDRFQGLDDSVRESLKADMHHEDEALKEFISTCRLVKWFEAALDLAKQDVQYEVNTETENGVLSGVSEMRLNEIEENIENESHKKVNTFRLRPKSKSHINGSVNGSRTTLKF